MKSSAEKSIEKGPIWLTHANNQIMYRRFVKSLRKKRRHKKRK